MKKFTHSKTCDKCGSQEITVEYVPADEGGIRVGPFTTEETPEYLRLKCACGYTWRMACLKGDEDVEE